jgi:hypothetical protein
MTRRVLLLVLLATLGVGGVKLTGADFAGSSGNPANRLAAAADWTPPTVALADPGTPITGSVSLSATGSDSVSGLASVKLQYRPSGASSWSDICAGSASPLSCSFTTNAGPIPDGLYDLRAVATDNGSNSASSVVADVRIDNTPPSLALTDPGAMSGQVGLATTSSDGNGSGVSSVSYQYRPAGSSTWSDACTATAAPFSCPFDTRTGATPDGRYDLRAVARDGVSLSTTSTLSGKWIDNTAPSSAAMDDPGALLTGTKTFSGSATDTASGVASLKFQYKRSSGSAWSDACTAASAPYSCSFDTSAVADGLYDLRVVAKDAAGNTTASTAHTSRQVDNGRPTVTLTDPGSHLAGSVTLGASASDGDGSGMSSVRIQYRPAGGASWTDICVDSTSPYTCSVNTKDTQDGSYELHAVGTDNAGLATTSATVTTVIDNTKPNGADIQTENGGATAGRAEPGDTLHLTYSEAMRPSSILPGWDGSPTSATVRFTDGVTTDNVEIYDGANTTRLELIAGARHIVLRGDYVPASGARFTATMVRNGATVTVTLGTLTAGGVNSSLGVAETMEWPPSKNATDLAGNACENTLVLELIIEGGVLDAEF